MKWEILKYQITFNGAPICRLVDENLRKERAMLAQAETKTKVPFANRNGKPDKSDGAGC